MGIVSTAVRLRRPSDELADSSAAFTIAYLLRILHSEDPALAANMAFEAIQRNTAVMASVGFDADLVRGEMSA